VSQTHYMCVSQTHYRCVSLSHTPHPSQPPCPSPPTTSSSFPSIMSTKSHCCLRHHTSQGVSKSTSHQCPHSQHEQPSYKISSPLHPIAPPQLQFSTYLVNETTSPLRTWRNHQGQSKRLLKSTRLSPHVSHIALELHQQPPTPPFLSG
jgi:hypothetical protein